MMYFRVTLQFRTPTLGYAYILKHKLSVKGSNSVGQMQNVKIIGTRQGRFLSKTVEHWD